MGMKRSKGSFLALVMIVLLGIGFMPAQATHASSYAISQAVFDWSGLSITGIGITWTSQNTNTSVYAYDLNSASAADIQAGWVASSSVATYGEATATGSAGASVLSANAQAGPHAINSPYSWANSYRSGSFTANQAGKLVVRIPFTLSYDISSGNASSTYAQAYAKASASLTGNSGGAHSSNELYEIVYNGDQAADSFTGTLKMNRTYKLGETGSLYFTADSYAAAYSPVPIPAPIMLLGAGLAGLAGLRKRIKA